MASVLGASGGGGEHAGRRRSTPGTCHNDSPPWCSGTGMLRVSQLSLRPRSVAQSEPVRGPVGVVGGWAGGIACTRERPSVPVCAWWWPRPGPIGSKFDPARPPPPAHEVNAPARTRAGTERTRTRTKAHTTHATHTHATRTSTWRGGSICMSPQDVFLVFLQVFFW